MTGTILLVDGTAPYRRVVATRLQEHGFEVVEAETAAAAAASLRSCAFDLVVVDNLLEDGDGSSLLLQFASESRKSILVVEPSFAISAPDVFCAERKIARLCRGPMPPSALVDVALEVLGAGPPAVLPARCVSSALPEPAARSGSSVPPSIGEIRRAYGRNLPVELAAIRAAVESARNAGMEEDCDDRARDVERRSHTIYGTAGTVGFPRTAEYARQINALAKTLHSPVRFDAPEWARLLALITSAESVSETTTLTPSDPLDGTSLAYILFVNFSPMAPEETRELARVSFVRTIVASSRDEALLKASGTALHGVVISLDGTDGDAPFELAAELRGLEGQGDLGVAFMSQDSSVKNRVAAASAGATKFLRRPVDATEYGEMARSFYLARQRRAPRVLIVDDDNLFRAHMTAMLTAEGMEVTGIERPDEVLERLDSLRPDLMLLDVQMPDISGWDVCRMVRQVPRWQHLPILFLTAASTPEARIACFASGGDDYIQKPCIKEELTARIGLRLERIRLFNERADRDLLTSLFNRRAFLDQFQLRMADSRRYARPLSLCILDLDHFKFINDTFGHLAGDRVLTAMGRLLATRFREVDIRCRWGGEEFAVAFYGEEASTAKMIMGRVLSCFRELTFKGDRGNEFHVTFSAGIACHPADGQDFENLYRAADRRLYKAKDLGRNQIIST